MKGSLIDLLNLMGQKKKTREREREREKLTNIKIWKKNVNSLAACLEQ